MVSDCRRIFSNSLIKNVAIGIYGLDVCVFVCGSGQQAQAAFTSTKTKTPCSASFVHITQDVLSLFVFFLSKLTGRPAEDLDVFP